MIEVWNSDLSYSYLRRLLITASGRFEVRPLADALNSNSRRPVLVLRHDLDITLDAALAVAELEATLGLRATYCVLLDWPLYDAEGSSGRAALRRLVELGHDVGLHADPRLAEGALDDSLVVQRDRLAAATGAPVRSLSFHRPPEAHLRGPALIGGMVNAYAEPLMRAYLSDSKGRFTAGDPQLALRNATGPLVQLLIHPVWWGERHVEPAQRLRGLADQLGADALAAAVPAVKFR